MKRSEMLSELTHLLNAGISAEGLLARLEELGFEPPAVKEPCQTSVVNQLGQVIGVDNSFVFVHRWEE